MLANWELVGANRASDIILRIPDVSGPLFFTDEDPNCPDSCSSTNLVNEENE